MEDKEFMELIGANIAKYRRACHMTQDELAEALDISTPFISKVERGLKKLKLKSLVKAAEILGVSCDALLKPDINVTPIERIQYILENKPDSYWKHIEDTARSLVKNFDSEEESTGEDGNDRGAE